MFNIILRATFEKSIARQNIKSEVINLNKKCNDLSILYRQLSQQVRRKWMK